MSDFDQLPELHDRDAVAEVRDDGEVVADQNAGQTVALPQPADEIEYFRLHRDVERRGRLVEQQYRRVEDQRSSNRHALALAARQLMRVAKPMRRQQTDTGDRPDDFLVDVGDVVDGERLAQNVVDGLARDAATHKGPGRRIAACAGRPACAAAPPAGRELRAWSR